MRNALKWTGILLCLAALIHSIGVLAGWWDEPGAGTVLGGAALLILVVILRERPNRS